MEPLSCKNCCHNPLQLGPVGTAFGYCTRFRLTLLAPQSTTCGQLLRKDLRMSRALEAREAQAAIYATRAVRRLSEPKRRVHNGGLVDDDGRIAPDDVVEEVRSYGTLGSRIATMAALHRVPGTRAEIAMLSLSRGYFHNCVRRGGAWTFGAHLLRWTLDRLGDEPELMATDIHGPITLPLTRLLELAKWQVLVFRLAFVSDVAEQAKADNDPVGALSTLADQAMAHTRTCSPSSLLGWLEKKASRRIEAAFPHERYDQLRAKLHRTN